MGVGEGLVVPNIVIILYELRMSKQTPLQHWLHHGQVHHVEEEEAQDGQVDDNRHLNSNGAPLFIFALTAQAVRLHVCTGDRHGGDHMETITVFLGGVGVVDLPGFVLVRRTDTFAAHVFIFLPLLVILILGPDRHPQPRRYRVSTRSTNMTRNSSRRSWPPSLGPRIIIILSTARCLP